MTGYNPDSREIIERSVLSGAAKMAGVLGWPVSHSRSPRLHGYWLNKYSIDGAYIPLPVEPRGFDGAVRALADLGFKGANVTLPHKERAFAICDTTDDVADRAGAVNTLVFREDGSIYGRNTDAFGFIESLKQTVAEFQPAARPALVVGAGGASRAVLLALFDAGTPEIRLTNRTRENADALPDATGVSCKIHDWQNRHRALEDCGLVINTTSLGMTGQPELEIDLARLPDDAVVYDLVYSPLVTPLLAAAKARGNQTVDGLGMLLHQARPGFSTWFGTEPEVDDGLRNFVAADLVTETEE